MKDIIDTRDLPTAYGSPIYAGHQPATDAPIVRQVKRAGGIVLGKTVTTEFAHLTPGGTRNPRNLAHTPGGSSSGSAAAVAAGMLPLAIGTQTGGSVIRPAAFCGVAGYKPTFRNLPTLGMKTFSWHLDTMGLFGARVQDVAFAVAALTGRDLDIGAERAENPRIGVVRTARGAQASPDAHAALDVAARAAAAAGAHVTEIDLPEEVEAADAIHPVVQDFEAWIALSDEYDHNREALSPACAPIWRPPAASTWTPMTPRAAPPSGAPVPWRPVRQFRRPAHFLRARPRAAGPLVHGIGHVQPAVDADGLPLHQRARPHQCSRPAGRRAGGGPVRRDRAALLVAALVESAIAA